MCVLRYANNHFGIPHVFKGMLTALIIGSFLIHVLMYADSSNHCVISHVLMYDDSSNHHVIPL